VPARPTRHCANEWLSPTAESSMPQVEVSSFVVAWRDGRNCRAQRPRRRQPQRRADPATLKQQGFRRRRSSSNLLPV
jgi:hypothetical protein